MAILHHGFVWLEAFHVFKKAIVIRVTILEAIFKIFQAFNACFLVYSLKVPINSVEFAEAWHGHDI